MFRFFCAVALVTASVAFGDPPKFHHGGFNFGIQYGPGFWTIDQARLATDPGKDGLVVGPVAAQAFTQSLQNTHTVSLSAGYTILGHVSLGVDLTATGWNLFDVTRGGGGFLIGKLGWHPLELIFLKKEQRPIPLEVMTYFGVGYGIVGGATSIPGMPAGMDGLLFEWGLNADYFFTRYFALGFFVRGIFLSWEKFYFDYNNRDQPGMTVNLSQPIGGSFWTIGITLTFRAGE